MVEKIQKETKEQEARLAALEAKNGSQTPSDDMQYLKKEILKNKAALETTTKQAQVVLDDSHKNGDLEMLKENLKNLQK